MMQVCNASVMQNPPAEMLYNVLAIEIPGSMMMIDDATGLGNGDKNGSKIPFKLL